MVSAARRAEGFCDSRRREGAQTVVHPDQDDAPPLPGRSDFETFDSTEHLHCYRAPVLSPDVDICAACSRSVTRTSMSSISIALAAWARTLSAARTRVDGGDAGSITTFTRTDTAALDACCSRAIDCPNAARRAS